MKTGNKVIITGGGTGGHIFPAIAIAKALKRIDSGVEILFVGARGKMEMEKVPEAGFDIVGLNISGFNRSSLWKNLSLPFKMIESLLEAGRILKGFKPQVVVGVGGYASFSILKMAQRRKIPTVIQEQNSFAGRTNILLGKKARKICVASKGMEAFFPEDKMILTGNPVRKDIVESKEDKLVCLREFGLRENKHTVFIVGGSLGARSVNEGLLSHLEELVKEDIQLIWQTGSASFEKVQKATNRFRDKIKVFEFIRGIEKAYAAADVIISRAGAMALAELSIVGKPVIFVPYPYAAENHQEKNAQSLVNEQAALMIKDRDVANLLTGELIGLLKDKGRQAQLSGNLKKMAIKDADVRIAREILNLI